MLDDQEGCAGEGACEALLSGGACAVGRVRELRRTGHGVDRPGGPFLACYLSLFPFLMGSFVKRYHIWKDGPSSLLSMASICFSLQVPNKVYKTSFFVTF